jgi:hypothetical protein
LLTCEIFVNSRFLAIAASPDGNIEYQWFSLCVVRTHTAENLQFSTRMFLPSKHRATDLAERINRLLYVNGKGYWRYAAWPPMTAKSLYKIDSPERITGWLREVARAGNQVRLAKRISSRMYIRQSMVELSSHRKTRPSSKTGPASLPALLRNSRLIEFSARNSLSRMGSG